MEHETIPFTVSFENPENDVKALVRILKPEWKNEELEAKKLSGGFSCIMYKCGPKTNNPNEEAVTIRARGQQCRDFPHVLYNRDFELAALKALFKKGLFPKIEGVFQNGYCYEFVKGTQVANCSKPPMIVNLEQIRKLGAKLAEVHSTKVEFDDPSFTSGTKWIDFLEMLLTDNYSKLSNPLEDVQEMLKDVKEIKKRIENLGLPKVLSHMDPQAGNVVIDEKGNYVYFDYEMTNIGYQPSDHGQFFAEAKGFPFVMPEDYEREYIRAYLQKWYEIQGESTEVSQQAIDEFLPAVKLYELLCMLFYGAILECYISILEEINEAHKTTDNSDPLKVAKQFHARYKAFKKEILV